MTNLFREFKEKSGLSYLEIAQHIFAATGREYAEQYLGNVARGSVPLSDSLKFKLVKTFPDFFCLDIDKNIKNSIFL